MSSDERDDRSDESDIFSDSDAESTSDDEYDPVVSKAMKIQIVVVIGQQKERSSKSSKY